jgi:hypothetical protein
VVGLKCPGQFVGEIGNLVRRLRAAQPGVQVDALAAARYRHRIESHILQDGLGQPGHLRAFRQPCAFAGIKVQDNPVRRQGVAVRVHPPLRYVDLQ